MYKSRIEEIVKELRDLHDRERTPCSVNPQNLYQHSHAKMFKFKDSTGTVHELCAMISVTGRVTFEMNGRRISRQLVDASSRAWVEEVLPK